MTKPNRRETPRPPDDVHSKLYAISRKLESLGVLLERQGSEKEGFIELEGLGIELRQLGSDINEAWKRLDPGELRRGLT